MEPSWETAFAVYGSVTAATWSEPVRSSSTACSTAALPAGSVIFPPSGALKTTRAVAPSALPPGKRSSSRSKARWASVPGMEKEPEVAAGADAAPTPARARRAIHSRVTAWRRRKANRPSL